MQKIWFDEYFFENISTLARNVYNRHFFLFGLNHVGVKPSYINTSTVNNTVG